MVQGGSPKIQVNNKRTGFSNMYSFIFWKIHTIDIFPILNVNNTPFIQHLSIYIKFVSNMENSKVDMM